MLDLHCEFCKMTRTETEVNTLLKQLGNMKVVGHKCSVKIFVNVFLEQVSAGTLAKQ